MCICSLKFIILTIFLNILKTDCLHYKDSNSNKIEILKPKIYYENEKISSAEHFEVFVIEDLLLNKETLFWKSTGLCPPDPHQNAHAFLLAPDMKQNFFHIGSLPQHGIIQVRIHWLLDLIKLKILPNFVVSFDFKYLDDLILSLWENGLQPGFELMGNPSNYFTDFENQTQVYLWKDMIQSLAEHYIGLFGIKYVVQWNFETWNEPDHKDFDNLNFTTQGFLNYYDACSEGLKAANPRLRLGGPGGSCRIPSVGHSPLCWALLAHCSYGKNYFSGEIGVRLDFISFHKKGNGSTDFIFDEELETMHYIRKTYPSLSHVPFYNDEADPLKNWALPQEWRADTTYAAMVVKITLKHIYWLIQKSSEVFITLMSSDNAFLSYFPNQFTQRTLLARFQINNTSPKHVEFVKKPVYSAFALLSKLCPYVLTTKVHINGKKLADNASEFGVIATACDNKRVVNVLMYNSVGNQTKESMTDVHLHFNFFCLQNSTFAIFEMDNINTNPHLKWKKLGKPIYPSLKQFSLIKDSEAPRMKGPYFIKCGTPLQLGLKMHNPSVILINICRAQKAISRIQNVRFLQTWNFTLQLSWTDDYNRCILTYIVEHSFLQHGPYHQLNKKNIIMPYYWHSCLKNNKSCFIKGFYRVKAIDYWNNNGPYSTPIYVRGIL
ncbi:alpha-L-iduronidase isoform X2 [Parasteatoda tepidariorum]|nr:alpha-L-iduronidase isoform X1 [Parasteatoda tepidariorum]